MNVSTERKFLMITQVLGPLSRSAALVMFAAVLYLAVMQDTERHTPLFQALEVLVFSILGFILVAGLLVAAIGFSIKCRSCGRRATFIGPFNPQHPNSLSKDQRVLSFFWPTRAYMALLQCNNCGKAYQPHGGGNQT